MEKKKFLILTVDDEKDIRDSVRSVLEDADFKVITAVDGRDCLKKLKMITPDLILLDILMPGLTTREILEQMRKKKIKIPIIFLTVVRLAEAAKKEIIKGYMADYIEKPFDNEDLVRRINKALKYKTKTKH